MSRGDPSNFRPIRLVLGSSSIRFLSERISKYLVGNGYIDVNTQKAFVGGQSINLSVVCQLVRITIL